MILHAIAATVQYMRVQHLVREVFWVGVEVRDQVLEVGSRRSGRVSCSPPMVQDGTLQCGLTGGLKVLEDEFTPL